MCSTYQMFISFIGWMDGRNEGRQGRRVGGKEGGNSKITEKETEWVAITEAL